MRDAAEDRHRVPEPGPIRPYDFPEVESRSLESGLGLRIVRMPRFPVVTMDLVIASGEASLEDDRAGLAVLTSDALEGGTRRRSGAELAEALEGIGTALNVSTGWDATSVTLSCLAERKEEAASLLAEVVLEPSFPEEEVERSRNQRVARIRQRAMDPSSRAGDEAVRLIYADGIPYGRPMAGTVETVSAMSRDTVRGFAEARYRPRGGGLVVVGDVDPDEIEALVRERFGAWEGAPPERSDFEALPRTRERTVHVVHRPGSVQSELRVGHPGVPRDTGDYFPLLVANTVLGGAFTSRLNLNLREKHGYTYGVRSRFAFRRNAGPFSISTAVGTDVTADAVRETVGEIEALVDDGLRDEEVESARDYIAGVFPLRQETTGQLASRLSELLVYDLPDDWFARYRERVRGVETAAAEAAVRWHLRPHEAQIVVLGDADRVVAPLEALELGPVVVHD